MILREAEDHELVRRAQNGDLEAYNCLVARWERSIFNYLLRLVSNWQDAEDLCQEVFLRAYQQLSQLKDARRFRPWLFRIAHNQAYSLLRRRQLINESTGQLAQAGTGLAQRSKSVSLDMELAVEKALSFLPEEQREAVLLKIYHGLKFEEIAEVVACPVSTVKTRVYTALDRLKDLLAPKTTTSHRDEYELQ